MMCFSSWSKSKYSASSLSPVEEKSIREVGGGDVASSGLLFALRNRFVIKVFIQRLSTLLSVSCEIAIAIGLPSLPKIGSLSVTN